MRSADKSGPVFASRVGGRLSHLNVQRRGFEPAALAAGLEGVTLHDLRHAYGSRLASKGLSARQIADAMRHKKALDDGDLHPALQRRAGRRAYP
jgi:integrase